MSTITVNGVNLEIDLLDADEMERFLNALNATKDTIQEMQSNESLKDMSVPDQMRHQCRIIDQFFDTVFGANTATRIFVKPGDLRTRMDAYAQCCSLSECSRQELGDIMGKYSPQRVNREQRRGNVIHTKNYKGKKHHV